MTRHARIPALLAMALTAAAGLALLVGTGQFRSHELAAASLEELETRIVGSTDGALWAAYGDKLRETGRFASAAKAYERALACSPELSAPRRDRALALAQAQEQDAFFAYFLKLATMYPKLASDLLERPELAAMRADPRWEPAAASARAQAID